MPSTALIILLLTVALPLLEIALLIKVGSIIGVWATLAIIVGTAVIGFTVAREQGFGVARRMIETLRSGQPPLEPMLEGMLLVFAGACLIAPGLITDFLGLVLLVPPLRQSAARTILRRHLLDSHDPRPRPPHAHRHPGPRPPHGQGPTIDGDYERVDDPPAGNNPGDNPRLPRP